MPIGAPLDATPEEVRALLAPLRHDFSVALHALGNPFAAGAIVRVAHNFLAKEVIFIGKAPIYEKASMGMQKYESVIRVDDDAAFFEHTKGRPIWAVEKDLAKRSLYDAGEFPRDVVFVFGSERAGLDERFVAQCTDAVGIPIYGVNNSLPVAVAAGITIAEWARRRYAPTSG
jgi:tRNA G18 (ribose-2'-O)-methylase SpoU